MEKSLKYTATAKWLHWFIGLVVILMLILGRGLEDMEIPERTEILMGHSGLGTIVLILMIARLAWRKTHQPPDAEASISSMQVRLSLIMHWSLYGLLILQPVLGILQAAYTAEYQVLAFGVIDYASLAADDAGMAKIFHVMHGVNATILSILVLGHIGAAFYHHFIRKDKTLRKMIPFGKVE
ncbi:MAG: cytochrome b561 [Candidatus Azotimanducaceae bacterium]|jgi:cytochrome b561